MRCYHQTGKCTKESQLHFFCKNWLFEKGSKFYINEELFEVELIEIEKRWYTQFGDYVPDVTVYTTSEKIIYFEMFFSNRKTGDDYFCKWDDLGNDVVEVNIKEYMFKTDTATIPHFTYLYSDGTCYSKPYIKRDLYANTIAKTKKELTRQEVLDYKAHIEQLDWFWQAVMNNTKESILNIISNMEYEDMVSCYEIIKKKQCVSYLKGDILNMINQKVVSDIRKTLNLSYDENIYFDLEHMYGRTYKIGIRLDMKTEHINYNNLFSYDEFYWNKFDRLKGFPKVIFSKNIFSSKEIAISEIEKNKLKVWYDKALKRKEEVLEYENILSSYEGDKYKIKMNTDLYTVLIKNGDRFDMLLNNCHISNPFNIDELNTEIDNKISSIENDKFLNKLFASEDYNSFSLSLKDYDIINIRLDIKQYEKRPYNVIKFKMFLCNKCVYDEELKREMDDFIFHRDNCKLLIQNFRTSYSTILEIVEQINKCKNEFWEARLEFDYNDCLVVVIDQKYFIPKKYITFKKVIFTDLISITRKDIVKQIENGMRSVMKNMEYCGYRVMEVK